MDKQALIKALRDTAQSASNSIATNVSAPVDLIAAGLNHLGANIQEPVGGEKWMRRVGMTVPVEQGIPNVIGETIGLTIPAGMLGKLKK